MFLLVGEILDQWKIKNRNWKENKIIKKFWDLMKKEGYIKINKLTDLNNKLSDNSLNNSQISYIISRWAHFKYTKKVLDQFPNLKNIFLFQIGNDNVDLEYCKQRWIKVVNFISQKSIYSVAEQTIASLIWWIRKIFTTWCNLKNWIYSRQPIWKNLENITIWVMGCGRIWQKVIDLLQIFPCKIITYDIVFWFDKKEEWLINLEKDLTEKWIEITSDLDYFLQKSNYISVHIPWFDENLGLLNYSRLQNIDWVVNMARAGIVVEEDVLKLLDENKLEFYVSDVIIWEPYVEKINQKLINHSRVFITPHIGANTIQVQEDIILQFLNYFKWHCYKSSS